MGAGPVPPGLLVQPAQLSRYNVPPDFLAQFKLRPFLLQVTTPGALGTMQFAWQYPGDGAWSELHVSTAGPSWTETLDLTFTDLTFGAGAYVGGDTYMVDSAGAVIPQGSAQAGLISAARYDQLAITCSAVTAEALQKMADAITQPLLSWDDDATMHAAAWVYEWLKYGKGISPEKAAAGDASVITSGQTARKYFEDIGAGGKPASMTDSSVSVDGPLLSAYPSGDCPRRW